MLVGNLSNHNHNDNNWFYEENNSFARTSRFLVHFVDVHCTTATWNLLMRRFMENVNMYNDEFSFLFLNQDKIVRIQPQEKSPTFYKLCGSK